MKRKRPTNLLCNRRRTTFRTMGQYKVITTYQWLDGGKGKYEKVARRVVMRQNTVGTYYWIATILWSPDRYVTRTTRGGATSSVVAASGVTDA